MADQFAESRTAAQVVRICGIVGPVISLNENPACRLSAANACRAVSSASMRKPVRTRTQGMPLDLHLLVRDAYRRAMAERRTEREAYDHALALVLARWPQTMARARRLVAVMLAIEPAPFGICSIEGDRHE